MLSHLLTQVFFTSFPIGKLSLMTS